MPARISLCVISGNEEPAVESFLDSFKGSFDEFCIVRAVGALPHDKTLTIAKDWCRKNGKSFRAGEYKNAAAQTGFTGTGVDEYNPATWPHVDDFAAARNMAWALATSPWLLWADLDDLLVEPPTGERGGSALIRYWAERGEHDQVFCKYDLRTQSQSCMRERLFRTGVSTWIQPLHEQCRLLAERDGKPWRVLHEDRIVYSHAPQGTKQRDPMRNRRIMAYHLKHVHAFAYELHREWFYDWAFTKNPECAEQATKWAELAQQTQCMPEQRFDMLLHQARIAAERDVELAIDICWSAIRINPKNRSGWGDLASYELRAGRGGRAAVSTAFMQSIPKQQSNGYPMNEHYYGWQGAHLRALTLRAAGQEKEALKLEDDIFAAAGKRISLLHATRGRPQQALECRNNWFRAAFVPLGVEHIFAIDADDAESIKLLKNYRHVIVENPNGCVKAWNAAAAASSGQVLIQLSDDWTPCHDWDAMVWEALESSARDRIEKSGGFYDNALGLVPLVLAVHDGHRNDALLCMAILTRARYEQQWDDAFCGSDPILGKPYIFSPDYFGVFSDNEFTHRSYDDGVVVQAQHIVFNHNHPVFGTSKMDATYARQNATERYAEGRDIFCRRNPKYEAQYRQTA